MVGGVIPVLYSFFTANGVPNLDAHDLQLTWAMENGATGVALLGLASEGAALSLSERIAVVSRTAAFLSPTATLLVTIRPDDDIVQIAKCALKHRSRVGVIVQVGRDPALSLKQIRVLCNDKGLATNVDIGMQLAPGLIDTEFTGASLRAEPDLLRCLGFLKAEYNSVDLDLHLRQLNAPIRLLVGRHGQNLMDYLRIGAIGVIPGTEMTGPLHTILQLWQDDKKEDALHAYGAVAPYVDFAMQDLDTVIDLGRVVTAHVLDIPIGTRRTTTARDPRAFQSAVDTWLPYWIAMNSKLAAGSAPSK